MFQVRSSTVVLLLTLRLHVASSLAASYPTFLHQPTAVHSHHRLGRTALSATPPPRRNKELHLLTFDLDDTIFPIGPVVADANAAQLRTLHKFGYVDASNERIIAASKQIRTELREAGDVVTYTDLRKQSIRREVERLTSPAGGGPAVHDSVIEAAFDAWLSERHASADRNLFPHASRALATIRERHPDAVVGAVTNGRGDPREMPTIARHFDFCVSGEDDGVFPRRKPDEGIYRAALARYDELRADTAAAAARGDGGSDDGERNWIHVGDDLANDVGASAACGAKSVWFATAEDDEPREVPGWSTATEEELKRRAAMDELAKGRVNARICSLEQLPAAVEEVLNMM
ncbi:hypothetical protein ACHAWF_011404 [Thalassiosira exigua]